ncbi:hypothetical protein AT984_03570 [Paucibacter sp. KCTC 42545]|nr:hypothetical protein AT984_03570 [Paucibacter sp. KCTC 42545]
MNWRQGLLGLRPQTRAFVQRQQAGFLLPPTDQLGAMAGLADLGGFDGTAQLTLFDRALHNHLQRQQQGQAQQGRQARPPPQTGMRRTVYMVDGAQTGALLRARLPL